MLAVRSFDVVAVARTFGFRASKVANRIQAPRVLVILNAPLECNLLKNLDDETCGADSQGASAGEYLSLGRRLVVDHDALVGHVGDTYFAIPPGDHACFTGYARDADSDIGIHA